MNGVSEFLVVLAFMALGAGAATFNMAKKLEPFGHKKSFKKEN